MAQNPTPKYGRESKDEGRVEKAEARRDTNGGKGEAKLKPSSHEHIGFIGDDMTQKELSSEGTKPRREPGLIDKENASRAVKFLNKSVERNEHAPMVGGHRNDHRTH